MQSLSEKGRDKNHSRPFLFFILIKLGGLPEPLAPLESMNLDTCFNTKRLAHRKTEIECVV